MSVARDATVIDIRDAFAAYIGRRVLATSTAETQKLSVALYRSLGRGAPVAPGELARACELSLERVELLLHQFPPTTVAFDERGSVVAFSGLNLAPTSHLFRTAEAELYTWCVFDALFLTEILGKPATLVTHCPGSSAELTVEMTPGEVRSARPAGCVMSIVAPDDSACCNNLREARNVFCDHVNLFKDEQAFSVWSRGRRDVGLVTLQEAQLFARRRNTLRYPDIDLNV
jgi:alkylmercury lyase